jgi:spermidine/putrescine transport system permease protein
MRGTQEAGRRLRLSQGLDSIAPAEATSVRSSSISRSWFYIRPLASAIGRTSVLLSMTAILYGPLLLLVVFSFNNSIILGFPLNGFTWTWYRQMFSNTDVTGALGNSVLLAAGVTPISLVLGIAAAYALTRTRFRFRGAAAGLIAAPLVVPWLLIGIGGLLFFSLSHTPLSLLTIGIMQIVACFPLVAAIVSARLVRFDKSLEEAALDLGATPRQVLRYVLLPILAPALAASAIIAFSWSFNNFTISYFTSGFELTFPIWVYSTLTHAINVPIVNALSTLVAVIQVLALWAAWRLMRARSAHRGADAVTQVMG